MDPTEQIDLLVAEAIANAKENGYDMIGDGWTTDAIATDMMDSDGDIGTYDYAIVVAAVDRYKENLL